MTDTPPTLTCANHPTIETGLRCKSCEKPICPKCAVLTPTGYRCKECVRGHQRLFETAEWYDYPLAMAVAGILSFLGSLIIGRLGFLALFVAPIAGVIIGEAVRLVLRRRRARRLFQLTAAAAAVGSLIPILLLLSSLLMGASFLSILFSLLWQSYYTAMVTSTVYYRLGGIQIK